MITEKDIKAGADPLGDILKSTRAIDHIWSPTWNQEQHYASLREATPVTEPIKVERAAQGFKDEGRDVLGDLINGEGQQARYVSNHGH